MLAHAVGRRGRPVLERLTTPAQRRRADRLLVRHGLLAVLVTRPVPLLAGTVALLAGSAALPAGRVALAGAAGTAVPALLYALAGAGATRLGGAAVFGLVLVLAALAWSVGLLDGLRRT